MYECVQLTEDECSRLWKDKHLSDSQFFWQRMRKKKNYKWKKIMKTNKSCRPASPDVDSVDVCRTFWFSSVPVVINGSISGRLMSFIRSRWWLISNGKELVTEPEPLPPPPRSVRSARTAQVTARSRVTAQTHHDTTIKLCPTRGSLYLFSFNSQQHRGRKEQPTIRAATINRTILITEWSVWAFF